MTPCFGYRWVGKWVDVGLTWNQLTEHTHTYLFLGKRLHVPSKLELVLLDQGAAHVVAAGLEEGEDHAAAVGGMG